MCDDGNAAETAMNFDQIRSLVTLSLCLAFAAFLGYALANAEYGLLLWLVYLAVGLFLFFTPGYVPLIALGLIAPVSLPIPFIRQFPFVALMLGLCVCKYMLRRWLVHVREPSPPKLLLPLGFALFSGWVLVRYCIDPALPNLRGFGENVSGFRPYLNYAVSFGLVISTGVFFRRVEDVRNLLRWMAVLSALFAVLLIALSLSKSLAAAEFLTRMGVYVTFFDNGTLRFVVLPGMGLVLLVLGLLPHVSGWSRTRNRLMIALGLVAIVMGGSRGSFLSSTVAVAAIALVRRRFLGLAAAVTGLTLCLVAFHYVGENFTFRRGGGAVRLLSIVSPRVAELTGARDTIRWRQLRWERAMQDIYRRPWIGHGYGGLAGAFVYASRTAYEAAKVEIDVVSGGVHNGFIAGARALGLPALGLFLFLFGGRIYSSARLAFRFSGSDPEWSELYCLVFAHLVALVPAIYAGTDLNAPIIWLYLILGILLERLTAQEATESTAPVSSPVLIAPRPAAA
jgi:hypothetical protein